MMFARTSHSGAFRAGLLAVALLLTTACGGTNEADGTAEIATPDNAATSGDVGATEDPALQGAGDFEDAPEVTLALSYPFGAEHHTRTNIVDPWIEEVRERTDGTVNFEVHPGGALADAANTYQFVADGAIDAGYSLQAYTPGRFPLSEFLELPFLFSSAEQATEAFWDVYESTSELQAEYEDTIVLGVFAHDLGELFTRNEAVETLDDIRGLNIRTPGAIQNELISALGGSPADLPGGELYDAMDRGTIDAYMIAQSGPCTLDLGGFTSHAALAGFYVSPLFFTMSPQAYEQLSPAQQSVIDDLSGRKLSLDAARDFDERGDECVDRYEDLEIEVNEVSDDTRAEWRAATQGVADSWIARQEDAGRPGQEIYDQVVESIE